MEWVEKWCGELDYQQALRKQHEAQDEVKLGHKSFIFGVEHPNTITLGVRGLERRDVLSRPSMAVVKVQRGGEATIHSPGQLVIYPVVSLKELKIGVKDFVEILMVATEQLCQSFAIDLHRKTEPGLYTANGKICFIGIQVKDGVTLHGLAINVSNDLSLFQQISVCGVRGERLDRLVQHRVVLPTENIFSLWCQFFRGCLGHGEDIRPPNRPVNAGLFHSDQSKFKAAD